MIGLSGAVSRLTSGTPVLLLSLLVLVLFLVFGYLVGRILQQLVAMALRWGKLDYWAENNGLSHAIGHVKLSRLCGEFVKWWVFLLFFQEAVPLIGFAGAAVVAAELASLLKILLIGLMLVAVGLLLGQFVRNKLERTGFRFKRSVGALTQFLIVYLLLVIGLKNLGVDVLLLEQTFLVGFTAFALVVAIVIGIGFGNAAKRDAQSLLEEIKKEFVK